MNLSTSSLRAIIVSIAFSGAIAVMTCIIAGLSLNLFIGLLLFGAILVPPLALQARESGAAWMCALSIVVVFGLAWLSAVIFGEVSIFNWMRCVIVLGSFVALLTAMARVLDTLRIAPIISSSLISILAMLWIMWPVWATAWMGAHSDQWIVGIHPGFAINGACIPLGIWTEQHIAYHLTTLGQDVAYQLPRSIYPAVLVHVGITVVLIVFNVIAQKRGSACGGMGLCAHGFSIDVPDRCDGDCGEDQIRE